MATDTRIAVLGAGTMGAGIAQLLVSRGLHARLFDVSQEQLTAARTSIMERFARQVAKRTLAPDLAEEALGRLAQTASLAEACRDAEVVIEAVPERMDLKVTVLSEAKALVGETCLLASNTSSLSLTELGARLGAAERVVGLHFFNPPPVMPLIEIVRGLGTSAETLARAAALAATLGKESITVRDVPGFATSRLGVVLGAEAIRMLESGVADAASIDRGMELGYGHPMGPLKLTDLVGLDVRLAILEHLQRELGEQFRPPPLLRQMVRAGRLGKKTGLGFYRWTERGPVPA